MGSWDASVATACDLGCDKHNKEDSINVTVYVKNPGTAPVLCGKSGTCNDGITCMPVEIVGSLSDALVDEAKLGVIQGNGIHIEDRKYVYLQLRDNALIMKCGKPGLLVLNVKNYVIVGRCTVLDDDKAQVIEKMEKIYTWLSNQ